MVEPKQKEKQSRARVFFSRASTTMVLWTLIALAVYFEKPVIFSSIIVILGVLGLQEFLGMLNLKNCSALNILFAEGINLNAAAAKRATTGTTSS